MLKLLFWIHLQRSSPPLPGYPELHQAFQGSDVSLPFHQSTCSSCYGHLLLNSVFSFRIIWVQMLHSVFRKTEKYLECQIYVCICISVHSLSVLNRSYYHEHEIQGFQDCLTVGFQGHPRLFFWPINPSKGSMCKAVTVSICSPSWSLYGAVILKQAGSCSHEKFHEFPRCSFISVQPCNSPSKWMGNSGAGSLSLFSNG